MPPPSPEILLVIPAYRESERLPPFLAELCSAVATAGVPATLCVVDDGSGAKESRMVVETCHALSDRFPFLDSPVLLKKNLGKGGAVYAGWNLAGEKTPPPTWLAFIDADGAISAPEATRFLGKLASLDPSRDCLYAVRVAEPGTEVKRSPLRRVLGNLFRFLVRSAFHLPCRDTQCGLKAVPASSYDRIRAGLTERRFAFDVDLTAALVAAKARIVELPISWEESPGSSVNLRASLQMLLALVKLRLRRRPPPSDPAESPTE